MKSKFIIYDNSIGTIASCSNNVLIIESEIFSQITLQFQSRFTTDYDWSLENYFNVRNQVKRPTSSLSIPSFKISLVGILVLAHICICRQLLSTGCFFYFGMFDIVIFWSIFNQKSCSWTFFISTFRSYFVKKITEHLCHYFSFYRIFRKATNFGEIFKNNPFFWRNYNKIAIISWFQPKFL
jgi:hypothetical protein